jgi:hypothetical protein
VRVQVSSATSRNIWHGLYGFGAAEDWGVWCNGPESAMLLVLKPRATRNITLSWQLRGHVHQQYPALECSVFINGRHFATWHFAYPQDADQTVTRKLHVPHDLGRLLYLRFEMREPATARHRIGSDETRRPRIGLEALTVAST